MEATRESHGNYLLIRITKSGSPEEDVPRLTHLLEKEIEKGATTIALKLHANMYPYSKMISVLVHAHSRLRDRGGELAVIHPVADNRRIFELLNLDTVMKIVASEDEL